MLEQNKHTKSILINLIIIAVLLVVLMLAVWHFAGNDNTVDDNNQSEIDTNELLQSSCDAEARQVEEVILATFLAGEDYEIGSVTESGKTITYFVGRSKISNVTMRGIWKKVISKDGTESEAVLATSEIDDAISPYFGCSLFQKAFAANNDLQSFANDGTFSISQNDSNAAIIKYTLKDHDHISADITIFNLKQQLSNSEVLVTQFNTVLQATEVIDGKPETVEEVKKALVESGFNVSGLNSGIDYATFWWNKQENQIVLVNEITNEIIAPEGSGAKTDADYWYRLN